MNIGTFVINSPNHFQGHIVHCPLEFDYELFDLYNITIKHNHKKILIGTVTEKKQKRVRKDSIGDKNSPSKRQRLESEQSQEDIEEVKDEPAEVKEKVINDPG